MHEGVRIVRDAGRGTEGVPLLFRTCTPHGGRSDPDDPAATLYRDRLEFDAGPITPAIWAGLWPLWQWRGLRLKQLAPASTRNASPTPPDPLRIRSSLRHAERGGRRNGVSARFCGSAEEVRIREIRRP